MKIRSLNDGMLKVQAPNGIYEVLVSDIPHTYDPQAMLGRIVVMPERGLVTLIRFHTPDDMRAADEAVVGDLAQTLCQEVRQECVSNTVCSVQVAKYQADVPEINGEVLSAGAICDKAASGQCPTGIRSDL